MEVSVTSALNLPPDSIISIRSGETRRQAPFKLNQVFRFPQGSSNPFKIDVFSPIGHHNVNANSLQEGDNTLKICMNSIELDLKITKGSNTNKTDVKSDRLNSALQARSYLDEHDLVSALQQMLQEVIKMKPADPMDYMVSYMKRNKKGDGADAESKPAPDTTTKPSEQTENTVPTAETDVDPAIQSQNIEEELELEADAELENELEFELEMELERERELRDGPARIAAPATKSGGGADESYEEELELELETELEAELELEIETELELERQCRGG